ncbi:MAG: ribosome silencing factor [Taibaiella sp.]|nr:ribosome silencing factor [Taibaiella sp.]
MIYTSAEEEQLFQVIIDAIQDKKAENIISLDLRNVEEAVASFFIICDVQSGVQMAAVAEHIEKEVRERLKEKPYQFELGPTWTLVDYINIVVHIFQKEDRKFYDLESLWMDADLQEHNGY